MLYSYLSWLSVFVLCELKHAETKSGTRNKRILFGLPGLSHDRDNYPSFRYFVFLAKGPLLDKISDEDPIAYWAGLTTPDPSDLQCGGSLLTPSIVQTACHCISNYFLSGKPGTNVSSAFPLNIWEDRIYSYFGSNLVSEMKDLLRPKHYVVYSKCRKLEGVAQIGMFDYGLILSEDSVDSRNPNAMVSYAPAYRVADILKFYYEALRKEFMCLLIGHGPYQVDMNLMVDPEASTEIRWGWRTVMNYLDCLSVSYNMEHRQVYTFNYTRDSTWVCGQAFSARNFEYYLNTEGDSGGPMTCNDVYFSVFSMTTDIDDEDNVISYSGPIVNTYFENAAEYRDNLLQFVRDFVAEGRPLPYPEDPRVTPTPPPDDQLFPVFALSISPRKCIHLSLMIICTMVFYAL